MPPQGRTGSGDGYGVGSVERAEDAHRTIGRTCLLDEGSMKSQPSSGGLRDDASHDVDGALHVLVTQRRVDLKREARFA